MNTSRLPVLAAMSAFAFVQAGAAEPEPAMHMHKAEMSHDKVAAADIAPKDDAQTAADYREEAAALTRKAASHRRQAEVFRGRGPGKFDGAQVAQHCESLASSYEKAAKEATAIADALSK